MLYYQAPDKALVRVQYPINQIMMLTANQLIIYYPDSNKAFRIRSTKTISLPFAQIFGSVAKEDYGLSDLGYQLAKHKLKHDTLFTYWDPPGKARNLLGNTVLAEVGEKLVYVEAQSPKGGVISKSFFRNHLESDGILFPGEVLTEVYYDSITSTEYTTYKNVQINVDLPNWVSEFMIPDSCDVEEIEW